MRTRRAMYKCKLLATLLLVYSSLLAVDAQNAPKLSELVWTSLPISAPLCSLPCTESYNVNAKETSVSGLSSGAFMAVQFHVALSGTLRGAGITAGGKLILAHSIFGKPSFYTFAGPYYCAQGSLTRALGTCLGTPRLIDVAKLVNITGQAVKDGDIDNTTHMNNSRVFLISGTKDTTVKQGKSSCSILIFYIFLSFSCRGHG